MSVKAEDMLTWRRRRVAPQRGRNDLPWADFIARDYEHLRRNAQGGQSRAGT
jgi:hypothetical protein